MRAADDFNPSRTAKRLLREAGKGALATLLPGGAPYASLVTIACAMDGAPILLLSRLARHTAKQKLDEATAEIGLRLGDTLRRLRLRLRGAGLVQRRWVIESELQGAGPNRSGAGRYR